MNAKELWNEYINSLEGENLPEENYAAWAFDADADGDQLADLAACGKKQATANSLKSFEYFGEEMPKVGNMTVILDGSDNATCIVKTTAVDIVPFNEVSEEFVNLEGEGYLNAEHWREVYHQYFKKEYKEMGIQFSEDIPVVCERFEVIYRAED